MGDLYDKDIQALVNFLLDGHIGKGKSIKTKDIIYKRGHFIEERGKGQPSDQRWIRALVAEARRMGHPIMSSTSGYYIATSYEDVSKSYNRLMSMASELRTTADALACISLEDYLEERGAGNYAR